MSVHLTNKTFLFSRSVKGFSHIEKGIPCQDASGNYPPSAEKNSNYRLIVVADGHGSASKSDIGSKKAVKITKEAISSFCEAETNPTYDDLYRLASYIVNEWHNQIEEEPCYNDDVKQYGTTLIVYVEYLYQGNWESFGFQIGDGTCMQIFEEKDVENNFLLPMPRLLDEDGKQEGKPKPAPWHDEEAMTFNKTFSICSSDAIDNFIYYSSIELEEPQQAPLAVFIGSDGIEDSFAFDRQDKNIYKFYKQLHEKWENEYGDGGFKKTLKKSLPEFSKNGSRDDVSIAGLMRRSN